MTAKLRALVASLAIIAVIVPAHGQQQPYFRMNAMAPASDSVAVPPMPGGPPDMGNPSNPTDPTTPTNPGGPPPMTGQPPTESPQEPFAGFDLNGYVGKRTVAFSTGLPTTNLPAPVTWTLAAGSTPLPAGLVLDPETGVVAGRPSAAGIFQNIMLRATSGTSSATTAPAIIAILAPTLTYTFANLVEGQPAAIEAASSNILRPAEFEVDPAGSALPTGLAIDKATGAISGRPAVATTVAGLRLRVTGADGASASAGPYTFTVAAATVPLASEVLPDTVALPRGLRAGESRLNVSYLLGQYVPDGKPGVGVGEAIEIGYAAPIRADGAHMFALPNADSFRVDALIGGQWQTVRSGMAQIGGNAAPRPFGQTVTAARFRIVNTGSQAWTNVTAGVSQGGAWAQLPVLTTAQRNLSIRVGQSISAGVDVYTGAMGYGSIKFKAPYRFALYSPINGADGGALSFGLPAGITLNESTGLVSGTAAAVTWTPTSVVFSGHNYGSNQSTHYVTVTDADGYTAFAPTRALTVHSNQNASAVAPVAILVNGQPVDAATRTALLRGTATVPLAGGSTVHLRYASPVYLNSFKLNYSGNVPNVYVIGTADNDASRMHLSGTAYGPSQWNEWNVRPADMWPVSADLVIYRTDFPTTMKGITVGTESVFPSP